MKISRDILRSLSRTRGVKTIASTLVLRGAALGGRFVFVICAARYMNADEFGRFGLIQALALIVSAVVGCEAYQVVLRQIKHASTDEGAKLRRAYGTFAIIAATSASLLAAAALRAMGWSGTSLVLGSAVVLGEHLNTEIYRNLVNEHFPKQAVLNVAMRTGVWGLLMPLLNFCHLLPRPWTLEMVLLFWLGGILVAFAIGRPLWPAFRPYTRRPVVGLRPIIIVIARQLGLWIATIVAWRVLENGGRFIASWQISEAAAGRYTLISMLASFSFIAQRGVVEPIYLPRLIVRDQHHAQQEYFLASLACIGGGAAAAFAAWGAVIAMSHHWPSRIEFSSMLMLLFAYSMLVISQLPHFVLYRNHKDSAIALATLFGAGVMASSAFPLTQLWGLAGVSASMALGSTTMAGGKWLSSRSVVQASNP